MRRLVLALIFLVLVACGVWVGVSAQSPSSEVTAPLVYTSATTYERAAWLSGGERFPAGAQIMIQDAKALRQLMPGFAASADPIVSFDGTKILFSGKRDAKDTWQVWEVAIGGGEAKRITTVLERLHSPLLSSRKPIGLCAQGGRPVRSGDGAVGWRALAATDTYAREVRCLLMFCATAGSCSKRDIHLARDNHLRFTRCIQTAAGLRLTAAITAHPDKPANNPIQATLFLQANMDWDGSLRRLRMRLT